MATKMLASRRLHSRVHYTVTEVPNFARELQQINVRSTKTVVEEGGRGERARAEQLLAVALYTKLVDAGNWSPVLEISDVLGVKYKRAMNIIAAARRRGYLSSPGIGSRGGTVSAKAISDAQALGLLP